MLPSTHTIDDALLDAPTGRGIKIAATGNPGTPIHSVAPTAEAGYAVWLYAINNDSVDRTLTIQFGGTTSPDDLITATVKANAGLQLIIPALLLGPGLTMSAYASAANQIVVFGFIRAHDEL